MLMRNLERKSKQFYKYANYSVQVAYFLLL